MAKLKGTVQFEGMLYELVAYTRNDLPGSIILQRRGGASSERVKTGVEFTRTRQNYKEFSGRSKAFKELNKMLVHLKNANDHNLSSPMNGLFRPIQQLDTVNDYGTRNVSLRTAPEFFDGYQLSKRNPLEWICATPLHADLDVVALKATVHLPQLIKGRNFNPIGTFPFYKWVIAMGLVPDVCFDASIGNYKPVFDPGFPSVAEGDWQSSNLPAEASEVELSLDIFPPDDRYCIVIAAGIMFGIQKYGAIMPVNAAGGGKILKVI